MKKAERVELWAVQGNYRTMYFLSEGEACGYSAARAETDDPLDPKIPHPFYPVLVDINIATVLRLLNEEGARVLDSKRVR